MKVAVIGSGISGLATAYLLAKRGVSVQLFEKQARIGGNMHTVEVVADGERRWVDLGVNDFNAATYINVKTMMDELGVRYRLLDDSAAFSSRDGSLCYTLDSDTFRMHPKIANELERFKNEAPQHAEQQSFRGFSIGRYLEARGYSQDFSRFTIQPRINAMFFTNETSPESMPLRAVMNYYKLQEGFGTGCEPRRMYFADGTQSWSGALVRELRRMNTSIHAGVAALVEATSDSVSVRTPEGDAAFDAVVLACPANKAAGVLRRGLTTGMKDVLNSFVYTKAVVTAHTYAPLLPDPRAWRTFNIPIRDSDARRKPYSISYVVNRHQNDAANPSYAGSGKPIFCSVNPPVRIPGEYILKQPDGSPAAAKFWHAVLTNSALDAQRRLAETVQGQNGIFFTGGWTNGTGLHEECWQSALAVSDLIAGMPSGHTDTRRHQAN